jgi:septum formation protein
MGTPLPFRLTLASGSRARRELLERAGLAFDVRPANIDEPTEVMGGDIRAFVQRVAWMKAAAVAPQVPDGVIIAADSVGWLNNQLILKPEDEADARRILRTLGGTVHELWTGVVVWRRPDDLQVCWQERTRVHLRALSDAELDTYLATREWQACSGAYAIQEGNDPYLSVIEGSWSNVVGLPMETLGRVLRNLPNL